MSTRIDITHLGKDEHGRYLAPVVWCATKCDGCGALGPREFCEGEHDHFLRGLAAARALSAGFVERLEGRLLKAFCPACAGASKTEPPAGQLELFR